MVYQRSKASGVYVLKSAKLLGHKNVSTTQIYTHVMNKRNINVHSTLEEII